MNEARPLTSTNELFSRWASKNMVALDAEERLARAEAQGAVSEGLRLLAAAIRAEAEAAKQRALDQFNAELRERGVKP